MMRKTFHATKFHTRPAASRVLSGFMLIACAAIMLGPAYGADSAPAGKNAFSEADVNRDGCVSLKEWEAGHTDNKAFYQADSKHTGCLGQAAFIKAEALSGGHAAGKYLSDSWITTKVKAALVKDEKLKGLDVKVVTHHGIVQLSGWVDSPELAQEAVRITTGVDGVKGVQDDLNTKK